MTSAALQWIADNASHEGDECLVFPFSRDRKGYGVVWVKKADFRRRTGAHRLMCELAHGEPPSSRLEAAHSCGMGRNGCVNPRHLRWATRKENAQDAVAHGAVFNPYGQPGTRKDGTRAATIGESHGRARLTRSDVERIRNHLAHGGKVKDAAEAYGVHRSTISLIKSGKNWSYSVR